MYYCRLLETFLILWAANSQCPLWCFFLLNSLDRHSHKLSFWIIPFPRRKYLWRQNGTYCLSGSFHFPGGSICGGKMALFLAVLGLCCFVGASSSCGKQGLLFISVCWILLCCLPLRWSTGSGRTGFRQLWCMHSVALQLVAFSQTRDQTRVPCITDGFLSTVPPEKSR